MPQVFIPYKEMDDLYNAGLKDYIPGDVTLMWAEDNRATCARCPRAAEAARSGGNGIYYHISYWGEPEELPVAELDADGADGASSCSGRGSPARGASGSSMSATSSPGR